MWLFQFWRQTDIGLVEEDTSVIRENRAAAEAMN